MFYARDITLLGKVVGEEIIDLSVTCLQLSRDTREMIYSIDQQIEYLSTAFTLEPGDLIFTGTPAGVGVLMHPQSFPR